MVTESLGHLDEVLNPSALALLSSSLRDGGISRDLFRAKASGRMKLRMLFVNSGIGSSK